MKSKNFKGFSVFETMIVTVLVAVVILGIYAFYLNQRDISVQQAKKAQLQRNLRIAMDIMIKDIRNAGYDPEASGVFGISSESTPTEIRYTLDLDEPYTDSNLNGEWDVGEPYTDINLNGEWDAADGLLGDGEEHRFRLDGTILKYTKNANVGASGGGFTWHSFNAPPIEISALGFTYSDISDPVDDIYDVVDIIITGQIKTPLGFEGYEIQTLNGKVGLRN